MVVLLYGAKTSYKQYLDPPIQQQRRIMLPHGSFMMLLARMNRLSES